MTPWLIALAVLSIGALLLRAGHDIRRSRGLGQGRTLELDDRTLYSARYGLAGRPDRIVEGNIPEEWKSSRRVYDSHRAQIGVYFLLIEEETGVAPPHGFISLKGGERVKVENTPELRAWVLDVADQIRAARKQVEKMIQVSQPPAKCRGCGVREACGQRAR